MVTGWPAETGVPDELLVGARCAGESVKSAVSEIDGGAASVMSANAVPAGFGLVTRKTKANVFRFGPTVKVLAAP